MKKVFIIFIALFISASAFSQEDFQRNEISLNLASTVLFRYPAITYQRILAPDFSIGASLGVDLSNDFLKTFNLTPFARWFFGGNRETMNSAGTGFFIEANAALFSTKINAIQSEFDFGIGAGIGWQFLTRNNWTGTILMGGGRGFAYDSFYLRCGVLIGRRF